MKYPPSDSPFWGPNSDFKIIRKRTVHFICHTCDDYVTMIATQEINRYGKRDWEAKCPNKTGKHGSQEGGFHLNSKNIRELKDYRPWRYIHYSDD